MRLNVIEFSSKQFTYNAADKTFTSEASDLDNRHLQQIYNDACDVGFAMKSDKTGNVITYVMTKPFYHGEGEDRELGGYNYVPTSESIREHPECEGTKVIVFND
jgi:hypothetical protein